MAHSDYFIPLHVLVIHFDHHQAKKKYRYKGKLSFLLNLWPSFLSIISGILLEKNNITSQMLVIRGRHLCSERTQVGVSVTSLITWFQPESGTRRVPIGVGNGWCMFAVCSGCSYRIKCNFT